MLGQEKLPLVEQTTSAAGEQPAPNLLGFLQSNVPRIQINIDSRSSAKAYLCAQGAERGNLGFIPASPTDFLSAGQFI